MTKNSNSSSKSTVVTAIEKTYLQEILKIMPYKNTTKILNLNKMGSFDMRMTWLEYGSLVLSTLIYDEYMDVSDCKAKCLCAGTRNINAPRPLSDEVIDYFGL